MVISSTILYNNFMKYSELPSTTIGEWRQAITSFGILYRKDKFDWDEAAEEIKLPNGYTGTASRSLCMAITRDCVAYDMSPSVLTALINVRVINCLPPAEYITRVAHIHTWVSDSVHDVVDQKGIDRFMTTAYYAGAAELDLAMPNRYPHTELPANTPMRNVYSVQRAADLIHDVQRASEIIVALTTDSLNIPQVFPPLV
jgi:hypothetical protein